MKRIAVLGNSHVAALALGWREIEHEDRSAELTFYAAPRDRLGSLSPDNGMLVPDDPKARESIAMSSSGTGVVDLSETDEIWLVGLGFGVRSAFVLYKDFVSDRMCPDERRDGLSTSAFRAALTGSLRRSLLVKLIGIVRGASDAPIRAIREPFPSTAIYDISDPALAIWRRARDRGDIAELQQLYEQASIAACDGVAAVAQQPAETLAEDRFSTLPEFCEGSVRLTADLAVEHERGDVFHMNGRYGASTIRHNM